MMKTESANLNLLWAALLIEELSRSGITQACIAPGSRSTPLTLAAAEHPEIECHTHFDERGLGFYALGLAKSIKQPVLLICTSGTAVANLYPAVIEAHQTHVPLIVLAGDRPAELIANGANQAIDQVRIFADYPVYQQSLPAPSLAVSPAMLLTSIAQLRQTQNEQAGPAYLNCPFREPFYPGEGTTDYSDYLAPLQRWLTGKLPFTQLGEVKQTPLPLRDWESSWSYKRGLVVIGAQSDHAQTQAIVSWAKALGWPVLVDVQSQAFGMDGVLHAVDSLLRCPELEAEQPELIVQFGAFLISKPLLNWLATRSAPRWYVDASSKRHDPNHQLAHRWVCDVIAWLEAHPAPTLKPEPCLSSHWLTAQTKLMQQQAELLSGQDDEVAMVAQFASMVPAHSRLMLGNSLPIRSMQWVGGRQLQPGIQIAANRGASGIDGLVATAMGCAATGGLTTLLIGDTSLLHDLNSLALTRHSKGQIIIVVINNDGGNIFDLLPGPTSDDLARDYYQMPHQMDFCHAARQFGLTYQYVQTSAALSQSYTNALHQSENQLIEVRVPCHQATQIYRQLGRRASEYSLCQRQGRDE